ncbi:hypothetical protein LCGC14_3021790, partial [marine sediment metagenome]
TKHGKSLNDIRSKYNKAVDVVVKRTTPVAELAKAPPAAKVPVVKPTPVVVKPKAEAKGFVEEKFTQESIRARKDFQIAQIEKGLEVDMAKAPPLIEKAPKEPTITPVVKEPTVQPEVKQPTEKVKEIKDVEKEAITEPPESPKVDTGKARGIVPTGELNPTNPKEALQITQLHANWVAAGGKFDVRSSFEGIRTTKIVTGKVGEATKVVTTSIEYTPEQIDAAYRTVQKPVESPMPDTDLFAMPGKEKQMKAIAEKMARQKALKQPKKGPKPLPTPQGLPKARAKAVKEDHIKSVFVATSKEASRYAINGILVEGENLVATDGRRMFIAKGKWGKGGVYLDKTSLAKGSLGKLTKEKVTF